MTSRNASFSKIIILPLDLIEVRRSLLDILTNIKRTISNGWARLLAFPRSQPGPNIDLKSFAWSNGLNLYVSRISETLSDRSPFQLLKSIGVEVELADVGEQKLPDGSKLHLPPVILGKYGNDEAKKTILIYGHLDVQPAQVSDGWDTEPFVLTEKNGKLFGRGSTDDKGPVLSWINVIEAYQKLNQPFPVNVKVRKSTERALLRPWIVK